MSGATRSSGGFELQSHLWQLAFLGVSGIELGTTVEPATFLITHPFCRIVTDRLSSKTNRAHLHGLGVPVLTDKTEAVTVLQHVELQRGCLVVIERNQFNVVRQINP